MLIPHLLSISLVLSVVALGQVADENQCVSFAAGSCKDCLALGPKCAWCAKPGFTQDRTIKRFRCDSLASLTKTCKGHIVTVDNTKRISKAEEVRDPDETGSIKGIQVYPQEAQMLLRPQAPQNISLTFRLASNYPVDLYYLMDLSYSMCPKKQALARLGVEIATRMQKITGNFQLGFGSFVDKVTLPFVDTHPAKIAAPCGQTKDETCTVPCDPPYDYKHVLSLTNDSKVFQDKVAAEPVSGNLDSPEGGFDALMQAMTCGKDVIGWRDRSRKMIIYSTDAEFHYAGDGRLAGIIRPNDMTCHMGRDNKYTESLNQDYPSISQIRQMAAQQSVNIIFAVGGQVLDMYQKLSKLIEGSAVGLLQEDSSNIVKLIEDNYNAISSTVRFKVQDNIPGVDIKFFTNCGNSSSPVIEQDTCEKVEVGDTVEFKVQVTVRKCPAEKSKQKTKLVIMPFNIEEKLTIDLTMLCDCPCEAEGHLSIEPKSVWCSNGNGTLICGKCQCNDQRIGEHCECDLQAGESQDDLLDKCRNKAVNGSKPCSGNGDCLCGECYCNTRSPTSLLKFSGPFCDCDNYACPYFEQKICGGPERGRCRCGTCDCKEGYNGTDCSCLTSKEACKVKGRDDFCNGEGDCICGKCKCRGKYRGKTCEDCPVCAGKCSEIRDCVQCVTFKTGPKADNCDCKQYQIETQEEVSRTSTEKVRACQGKDDNGCTFYFTYQYNERNEMIIKSQETAECPKEEPILWIVLGVIIAIVLLGLLLLLIWKCYDNYKSGQEFAAWEKDQQNIKWSTDANPLFEAATTTYGNPTYAGGK